MCCETKYHIYYYSVIIPCHHNHYPKTLVQSLSRVLLFATPWTAARQASLSITNSRSLLKLMSTESRKPSNHLIFCCPLFLLPSIFPSIGVFSHESALCSRWPKDWSYSFSISPSVNIQDSTTICSINPAPVCLSKGGEIRILRSIFRRRQWHPTPVLLPGETQGWGNLVGPSVGSHRVGHD